MPKRKPESAIPVGTQFNPKLIDFSKFLTAIVQHSGDAAAMQTAVWRPAVRIGAVEKPPTKRRARLPLEAAVQYGLLEASTYAATTLAKELAGLAVEDAFRRFARHILLNCGGLRIVEAVEQMRLDGLDVTGDSLAAYLTDQGFRVTIHNTAINSLRMWLAAAGLFPSEGKKDLWIINADAKESVLGLKDDTLGILAGLQEEQRAFLLALCRIAPEDWCQASDVRNMAEATSGLRLRRESLPMYFLEPLKQAGLIEYQTGGTAGGKSARLRTLPAFTEDVLRQFVSRTIADLDQATAAYYTKRPTDIYRDLESSSGYVKGRALEAYSVHLMRLLGLRLLEWRERAAQSTGWAEVDAVFVGLSGVAPTRWQVQCKNTPKKAIDLETVAREVGLLPITQATHILIVGTSSVTQDARKFARQVMHRHPVTIFLLDDADFAAVKKTPGTLGSILRAQAEAIVREAPDGTMFAWKKK